MDATDSWTSRLSSSSSSFRGFKLRSAYFGGDDDVEEEDDYKQEFSCPFCADEFDIMGLFCHMDEDHQVELKNGVFPVCAKRVGMDMVGHITMQYGNLLRVQRRRRLRRGLPDSMLGILRKELREGNRQSHSGGSSFTLSSSPDPDPLLSSFINSSSSREFGKGESHSSQGLKPLPKSAEKIIRSDLMLKMHIEYSYQQQSVLSEKEHEEKTKKCEFVQGLLFSTILDDIL